MKIIDLDAYLDRIGEIYDTACELDVLLGDLRHAVHGVARTPGVEIDLRLPKDVVHALGHLDARIGLLKDLSGEMANMEDI